MSPEHPHWMSSRAAQSHLKHFINDLLIGSLIMEKDP